MTSTRNTVPHQGNRSTNNVGNGTVRNVRAIMNFLHSHHTECKNEAVLIGSRALHHVIPNCRTNIGISDWDMIATYKCVLHLIKLVKRADNTYTMSLRSHSDMVHVLLVKYGPLYEHKLEIYVAVAGSSGEFILNNVNSTAQMQLPLLNYNISSGDVGTLWAIKRNHIYWPHNFIKHITDIHLMQTQYPSECTLNDTLKEIMECKRREKEAYDGVPGADVNLNKSNTEFLTSYISVERVISHDSIHELVKFEAEPLYKRLQTDPDRTWCPQHKFMELTPEQRLNDIREEAMVLALERYILPGTLNDNAIAYTRALTKICTTTTKGYFRDYAIEHWPQLRDCPKDLTMLAAPALAEIKIRQEEYYPVSERIAQYYPHDDSLVRTFRKLDRDKVAGTYMLHFTNFRIEVRNTCTLYTNGFYRQWNITINLYGSNMDTIHCSAMFHGGVTYECDSESEVIQCPTCTCNMPDIPDGVRGINDWQDVCTLLKCIYPDCLKLQHGGDDLFRNGRRYCRNEFTNVFM